MGHGHLPLTRATAAEAHACARSRWKIENETFNTLKNQGYELEHNFGHGHQHLPTVLMLLLLLAFLIRSVAEELCCPLLFQAARTSEGRTPYALWEGLRSHLTPHTVPRRLARILSVHRATVAFHYTRFRYFLNPHWDRLPGNNIRTDG